MPKARRSRRATFAELNFSSSIANSFDPALNPPQSQRTSLPMFTIMLTKTTFPLSTPGPLHSFHNSPLSIIHSINISFTHYYPNSFQPLHPLSPCLLRLCLLSQSSTLCYLLIYHSPYWLHSSCHSWLHTFSFYRQPYQFNLHFHISSLNYCSSKLANFRHKTILQPPSLPYSFLSNHLYCNGTHTLKCAMDFPLHSLSCIFMTLILKLTFLISLIIPTYLLLLQFFPLSLIYSPT
jgi:hypothetical protein